MEESPKQERFNFENPPEEPKEEETAREEVHAERSSPEAIDFSNLAENDECPVCGLAYSAPGENLGCVACRNERIKYQNDHPEAERTPHDPPAAPRRRGPSSKKEKEKNLRESDIADRIAALRQNPKYKDWPYADLRQFAIASRNVQIEEEQKKENPDKFNQDLD